MSGCRQPNPLRPLRPFEVAQDRAMPEKHSHFIHENSSTNTIPANIPVTALLVL